MFTRLILDDPELKGVAAVLFDEFHERSLDADLGLALARDAQQGLREDLKILVMSATIDGARVAALLGNAPVIESQGRAFPVETRYVGRDARARIEDQMADAVTRALRAEPGSVLAFLPGAAEIRRTETLLKERVDAETDVVALYGALDADTQDRAISPAPAGRRKVVLATSIAETSLTIEGVRIVVDSGLARVPRYEPDVGLTRLETVRVSRAAADQRRGRAGRTEPGVCYRLWDEPQTASLEPYARPEILSADLSGFVLDLAAWGAAPETLAFLDPPPKGALAEARALLTELGALDDGRITEEGHALRRLPLPPRLARMVVDAAREGAGALAADIAAVLTERGLGGDDVDLTHRVENFRRDRSRRASDARAMAKRWARARCRRRGGRGCEHRRHPLARLSGPHREEPRQWRVHARERARRQYRSGLAARARAVHRGRRTDRQRRECPHRAGGADRAGGNRAALRGSHRKPRRGHVRREIAQPARAALAPARRHRAGRADAQGRAERRDRARARRRHRARRHRQAAVDQGADAMARPRDVPAQGRRRRVAGPVRCGARRERRLARSGVRRQDRGVAALAPTICTRA